MIDRIREILLGRKDEREEYKKLVNSKPSKITWVTQSKQRWYVAYNYITSKLTTTDIFSSELAVFSYPIGITDMSVPKYFIPSPMIIRMLYSLEWIGGDLRPEKKYRALKRPGVVEVLY